MNGMLKKYLPYALIIFLVYMLVPLIFISPGLNKYSAVAYYFIFLLTQVGCSAFFCAKHGLDFLFALIAPIAFLPSMLIYNGGFTNWTNLVLLVVYLVAGIFGLFLGDLAFGDARRKQEKKEKQEAEEMLLQAKRRDERERQRMARSSERQSRSRDTRTERPGRYSSESSASRSGIGKDDDDDFDYDKYLADIDRILND